PVAPGTSSPFAILVSAPTLMSLSVESSSFSGGGAAACACPLPPLPLGLGAGWGGGAPADCCCCCCCCSPVGRSVSTGLPFLRPFPRRPRSRDVETRLRYAPSPAAVRRATACQSWSQPVGALRRCRSTTS